MFLRLRAVATPRARILQATPDQHRSFSNAGWSGPLVAQVRDSSVGESSSRSPTGGTADRHARSSEHAAGSASEPLGNLSFVSHLAEPSATCIQSKSRSCNERSAFFFSDIHRRAPRAPLLYAVAPLPSGNTLPDAPVWPRKLPPSKFFHPYGNAPTVSSVRPHAGGLLDHLGRLSLLARPRRCFRRRSGPQHHLPVLERVATALQRISEHTTCAPAVSAPSS